jgi:hypothetical protein
VEYTFINQRIHSDSGLPPQISNEFKPNSRTLLPKPSFSRVHNDPMLFLWTCHFVSLLVILWFNSQALGRNRSYSTMHAVCEAPATSWKSSQTITISTRCWSARPNYNPAPQTPTFGASKFIVATALAVLEEEQSFTYAVKFDTSRSRFPFSRTWQPPP